MTSSVSSRRKRVDWKSSPEFLAGAQNYRDRVMPAFAEATMVIARKARGGNVNAYRAIAAVKQVRDVCNEIFAAIQRVWSS